LDSVSKTVNQVSHPLAVVQKIKEMHSDADLIFEYSIYTPGPPGITLSRRIKQVNGDDVCQSWLQNELDNLSNGEELAWHSKVLCSGKTFHIPMADFMGQLDHNSIARISALLHAFDGKLFVYDSGRSLHVYVGSLIDANEWHSYLGTVLLLNPSGTSVEHIVDCRWVGHSLENGFSALRWSLNTERYTKLPSLIAGG